MSSSIRNILGCWLHERWRLECAVHPIWSRLTQINWYDLCNRGEKLLPGSDAVARQCDWRDSSLLTVSRVFPDAGSRLLKHCFKAWPVCLSDDPPVGGDELEVSVIVPVGGADRLKSVAHVVKSLFGQRDVLLEIIIVEHAEEPLFETLFPSKVKYIHLPRQAHGGFNKSACLNEGVRKAIAPVVVLHDADAVLPADYLKRVLQCIAQGYEAVQPVRFLFYLGQQASLDCMHEPGLYGEVEGVRQNFPGLSTAVVRSVYWEIGGHDEQFEGWGGEDVEFLDRLRLRKIFLGGYAPALHLWHPAQLLKYDNKNPTVALLDRKLEITPQARIAALKEQF